MLTPMGRMFPADPDHKWVALGEAAKTADETERIVRMLRVNAVWYVLIPLVLSLGAAVSAVAIYVLR
jgi:hypothetical protein